MTPGSAARLAAVALVSAWACTGGKSATTSADASSTGTGGGGSSPVSSSGPTSTTTSTGGADGGGPIMCGVPYDTFMTGTCDLLQQNCPEGQTCRPYAVNNGWAKKCVSGSGLKGPGDPCTTDNECWPGLFCVGTAPDSLCRSVCCPDAQARPCAEPGSCTLQVNWDMKNWATMCTYSPQCKLLTQDACPTGTECHLQDPTTGLANCMTPSDAQSDEGGPCVFLNDCKDMQYCFQNVCRYNCYISAKGQGIPGLGGCPQGQMCTDQNINIPDIGVCKP